MSFPAIAPALLGLFLAGVAGTALAAGDAPIHVDGRGIVLADAPIHIDGRKNALPEPGPVAPGRS